MSQTQHYDNRVSMRANTRIQRSMPSSGRTKCFTVYSTVPGSDLKGTRLSLPAMMVIGCRSLHVCIWWRPHGSIWWGEEGWIEVKGRWDGPRGRYSQMRR